MRHSHLVEQYEYRDEVGQVPCGWRICCLVDALSPMAKASCDGAMAIPSNLKMFIVPLRARAPRTRGERKADGRPVQGQGDATGEREREREGEVVYRDGAIGGWRGLDSREAQNYCAASFSLSC